jgi:CheY-like chemotaxis protein
MKSIGGRPSGSSLGSGERRTRHWHFAQRVRAGAHEIRIVVRLARTDLGKLGRYTTDYRDISLIVLDLVMPQMSGWEFLAIVKSYYRLAAIPVFIVSGARPHPETLQRHTVQGYFPKPVDALAFVDRIGEVAGRASTVDRKDPDGGPFQGA